MEGQQGARESKAPNYKANLGESAETNVCVYNAGAMRTCSKSALEVILGLTPLHLIVLKLILKLNPILGACRDAEKD